MSELSLKEQAQQAKQFLNTQYGAQFITKLSLLYNNLHQEAENEGINVEAKAMKIERAAGLKIAITELTGIVDLLDQGLLEEKEDDNKQSE